MHYMVGDELSLKRFDRGMPNVGVVFISIKGVLIRGVPARVVISVH